MPRIQYFDVDWSDSVAKYKKNKKAESKNYLFRTITLYVKNFINCKLKYLSMVVSSPDEATETCHI